MYGWVPYTGAEYAPERLPSPNFLTDIDVYLGTNASQTTSNETQGGVIENLTVAVSRDLGRRRHERDAAAAAGAHRLQQRFAAGPIDLMGVIHR